MAAMKAISASIVILTGSLMVAIGATAQHADTQTLVCIFGGIVVAAGLYGWYEAMFGKLDK